MKTRSTPEMRRSWLVQRLNKPRSGGVLGPDNVFAFGGGLRNGGLSEDAMGLLRGIFSFDYMGAAEFEFGAVPEALDRLARASKSLTAGSFEIPLSQVADDWRAKPGKAPTGQATVYYIAPGSWADEVERRVRDWAAKGFRSQLKEATQIHTTLKPTEDYHGHTVGWLELDNGFFAFTDQGMWAQVAALFGVRIPAEVSR